MDGDVGFEGLDSGQQQQGNDTTTGGIHPAWDEMLGKIPQELHSQVTPYLQNWGKEYQRGIQKVHQEYEPWKGIVKNYDPDTTQYALQMLSALENDPKAVYKAIGDFYKDQLGDLVQPSGQGPGEPNKDLEDKPWMNDLAQLRQENQLLAKALNGQYQTQQAAHADAALDEELNAAKAKFGEYDERFVLGLMANAKMSAEEAVQAWQDSVKSYAGKLGAGGPKPFFMSGGSAIPGRNVDLKQASDKETKNVVVEMLQAAAMQNRQ